MRTRLLVLGAAVAVLAGCGTDGPAADTHSTDPSSVITPTRVEPPPVLPGDQPPFYRDNHPTRTPGG